MAEVYRTAVGGRNRSKGLVWAIKKADKEALREVEETMKEGFQCERGDMILDAHARLFEVVGEEMELSIKPRVVVPAAVEQFLEEPTEQSLEEMEMEQLELEQMEMEHVVLEQVKGDEEYRD